MTALEELTRVFGDAEVASTIIEALRDNGMEIKSGTAEQLSRGHTAARLAKVELANVDGPPKPRSCVIKYCPPAGTSDRRESRRHKAAYNESPDEIRVRHLADFAFPPVACPEGALVIGQFAATGVPLGAITVAELGAACEVIWTEVLEKWAGRDYDSVRSTLGDLLEAELGGCFRTGGWLHEWALARGLLGTDQLQLPGEDGPLPNPWRLFAEGRPETRADIRYLAGRTHGDLHGDNVLVPVRNGRVYAADFRLIDLATYDKRAPLSRDLATLLVSLSWREIGECSSDNQSAFLSYLERGYRDERLDGIVPGQVRKIIDAVREPAFTFVVKQGQWDEDRWFRQVRVSLLAQAMLHSTYGSGTEEARRWCSRLACRLTRILLGSTNSPAGHAMSFDAGNVMGAAESAATSRSAGLPLYESVFLDRTDQRRGLRAALKDPVTSLIVVSGPPGIGKTALVREVLADLGRPDPDIEGSAMRWHDATRYGRIDVPTLVEDIEQPGFGQVAGPEARARLEIALDGLDGSGRTKPIIVIDAAENLLDNQGGLRDSELDLALEAVHSRLYSPIKIVLVTQRVPVAITVGGARAAVGSQALRSARSRRQVRPRFLAGERAPQHSRPSGGKPAARRTPACGAQL